MHKAAVISLYNGILLSLEKKILLVAAMWTNLENIMRNEISQAQKENIFHLYVKSKTKCQIQRGSDSQGGEEEKKWRDVQNTK